MIIRGKEISLYNFPLKAVNYVIHNIIAKFRRQRALFYLSKWNENSSVKKMSRCKVAFLVQLPEVWDKEEPLYDALINNSKFEVRLIVIPPYNMVTGSIEKEYNNNYFLLKYKDALPAYSNGVWIDLKNIFHYVFYQRPYDYYLPKKYRSYNLVKHTKCCYVPYGFSGSDNFNECNTNEDFFCNMYFCFAESKYSAELLRKKFHSKNEKDLYKIEDLGYPALIPYFSIKPTNKFNRVLWTPRWSYDTKLGGSHFLEYKDTITNLINDYPNIALTFRPHPLLFEELIIKHMMSKAEIEDFLRYIKKNSIKYDMGRPILEVFRNTDVLITDFSTIIIQFFITGRPIIYCQSSNIILNKSYQKLLEGLYIANNEKEVIVHMKNLQNGNDYLYKKRQEIISELSKYHCNATNSIVKRIEEDFFGVVM